MIVHVLPHYNVIPSSTNPSYATFCWSELLLYFPFRTLPDDIGSTDTEIIAHWEQKKGAYTPWHVHREPENPQSPPTEDQPTPHTPLIPFRWMNGKSSLNYTQVTILQLMAST